MKWLGEKIAKQEPGNLQSIEPFGPPRTLNTEVLFLVFNRPDTMKQVFEAIRTSKLPKLYVAVGIYN